MELVRIKELINKYLEAQTTLQEENLLRDYFTAGNVAPEFEEFGILFGYFKENEAETFTKPIELKPIQKNFKWISVAASIALVISAFIGSQEYKKHQQRKQFAQIKEALQMVSSNLNKGNDALYAVSDNINKGTNAMNQIETFSKTVNKANQVILNKK